MEGKNLHIYIPMEVCLGYHFQKLLFMYVQYCKVLGQKCNKKLTPEQTSAMIRHTAKPAYERQRQILDKVLLHINTNHLIDVIIRFMMLILMKMNTYKALALKYPKKCQR